MPRPHHLSIRLGSSYDRIRAMAAAQTTPDDEMPASKVVRSLLAEALTARVRECGRGHQGPIRDAVCAHCGGPT